MIRRDYDAEAEEAQRMLDIQVQQADKKRQHELEMSKLKLQVKPRSDTWRTLFKAPTYPLVVFCITVLSLAKRQVPSVLEDFLVK